MDFDLGDQVVCVTGGASGIGLACSRALAREKAQIAIIDRRQERIDAVLDELAGLGAQAVGFAVDVRQRDQLDEAVQYFETKLGPVTNLICCAGTSRVGWAEDIPEKDFDLVLDVNTKGVFLSCQAFAKRMIEQRRGSIILMGSIDGLSAHTARSHYVASKFAVIGLTKNLALEWGRFGIRVNCIAPSFADTPLVRQMTPPAYLENAVCRRTPMGRMVRPEEIASATLMLLSDAAAFVTGVVLPVDGGLSVGYVTEGYGADAGWNPLS